MLTYKQAKELKDAGFPQENKKNIPYGNRIWVNNNTDKPFVTYWKDLFTEGENPQKHNWNIKTDVCKIPTLSELIDACGEDFFRLMNFNGVSDATWQAEAHKYKGGKGGKTPEEAVAKLWIKLNKK